MKKEIFKQYDNKQRQRDRELLDHHAARDLRIYLAEINNQDIRGLIREEDATLGMNPQAIPQQILARQQEELRNYHMYREYRDVSLNGAIS